MWRLYHHPLCPFSRKVRITLGEKRIEFDLRLEESWQQRKGFLALNPAGMVPVLYDTEDKHAICDSTAIVEFLDETVADSPVLGDTPHGRAEVRRLVAWFDIKFYHEVTAPLFDEHVWKRLVVKASANPAVIRAALRNIRAHLDYIEYLTDRRRWLAGDAFSLADIAAAAHVSIVDYLGGVDWDRHEAAKLWYMRVKSRPSFRPLLGDRMAGSRPAPHYANLDF